MINLLLKMVYYIVYKITLLFDFYFYESVLYLEHKINFSMAKIAKIEYIKISS